MMKIAFVGWPMQAEAPWIRSLCAVLGATLEVIGCRSDWFKEADRVKNADFAIIWNGNQYNSALAVNLCRRQGVPHVLFEFGLLPQKGTFLLDPQGFNGESSLCEPLGWVTDQHMRVLERTRAELQKKHPLTPEGFVLAPMQIHNDTQVLYNTPYRSMEEWQDELAVMYPDQSVVVRPHPKSKATRKPRGSRQTVDTSGEFLSQAARASVVVGLTSTCLAEAAILGVPVVALGDGPFRRHRRADHDRVAAAYLARTVSANATNVLPVLADMNLLPGGAADPPFIAIPETPA